MPKKVNKYNREIQSKEIQFVTKKYWKTCPACSGCGQEAFDCGPYRLLRRCSTCDGRKEIRK